jgi:hypothetical protein
MSPALTVMTTPVSIRSCRAPLSSSPWNLPPIDEPFKLTLSGSPIKCARASQASRSPEKPWPSSQRPSQLPKARASSSKTAVRASGARPSAATGRPVSAGAEATLMPMPMAAARPAPFGNAALSIKIPAILAPPSKTSFGHLRRRRPSCSECRWLAMASYAASAATNESWVAVLAPTPSRSPRVA